MYTFNEDRKEELIRVLKDVFTENEKKLLYQACKFTADELVIANNKFQYMINPSNEFSAKAGQLYEMAQTLRDSLNEENQREEDIHYDRGFNCNKIIQ